jgi:hypothetical protein
MASGLSSHVTWWMAAITDGVDDMVCIDGGGWRELHARMAGKAEWKEAGRDCGDRS